MHKYKIIIKHTYAAQYNIFWGKSGQLGQGTSVVWESKIDQQSWDDCKYVRRYVHRSIIPTSLDTLTNDTALTNFTVHCTNQ